MRRWGAGQLLGLGAASAAGWALVAAACLLLGETGVVWPARAALGFRLEETLVASLVGAALAVAGTVYQAVLRNPLAEPYLLGVSSGAALLGYLASLPLSVLGSLPASVSQQVAAFVGAVGALAIVLAIGQRRGRLEPVTLLLVGVIVNAVCSSLYLLVFYLNLRSDSSGGTGGAFRFLIGGINTNLTAQQRWTAAAVVGAGWVVLAYLSGQLNVATLGEAEAQSLGVRIHRLRWVALLAASLVAASAVAISGPIGFIGLICPHLARLIVGTDQRRLVPVATAMGAALLALADGAARRLAATDLGNLPVGVLTGMLGGPFFLLLLWRQRRAA